MASLDRKLRKDLETTVKKARRIATAGAKNSIAQLGVGDALAPRHLAGEQPALRNKLRAHGRQLGDRRDPKTGVQETERLAQECAYEHWHRMLFARFLAETDLLIEPQSGVAITLEEVQELAREKGTDWLPLASEYAERMLPQIFRADDPVLDIALPPETRSELEDLLKALPKAVFEADDSLGWVYQFWQAEKKEEVNKSEVKIGADELPAVTQLFTEDYMVLFLLHNTLGAWWAGKVLAGNPTLAASASSEDALRAACRVGDVDWAYLRFARDTAEDGTEGPWRPAGGTFEGWPKAAKDITVLDPCMGSGHFLVFALPILVAFRMSEEGLSERDSIAAVLRENLYGLEIDPRCTQIAAFNLAFAAWRRTGFHVLPQLNLACSGIVIGVTKAEWLRLAERAMVVADPAAKRDLLGVEQNLLTHGLEERVKNGLEALYDLFAKAPSLGSLIDPRRAGADILREGFDKLEPLLASILAASETDDAREMAVAAKGMTKAAELLGKAFTLIVTNVPYLGRSKQEDELKNFSSNHFPSAEADLATSFGVRLLRLCTPGGTASWVSPQNWLFLKTYTQLRRGLLNSNIWNFVFRLGPKAFQTPMWDFNVALLAISSKGSQNSNSSFVGGDVSGSESAAEKADSLSCCECFVERQADQLSNPDARIVFGQRSAAPLLEDVADCVAGVLNGDSRRFILMFWEVNILGETWKPLQSSFSSITEYDGRSSIIRWENGTGALRKLAIELRERLHDADRRGNQFWGKKGIAISQMGGIPATIYTGEIFDSNVAVIHPKNENELPAIWAYVSSDEFRLNIRAIDQKLNVTNATLAKVPFEFEKWQRVFVQNYPNGLPKPSSTDPTQWLFDGNPIGSDVPLSVIIPRLLGYNWPLHTGSSFLECPAPAPDSLNDLADDDGIVCLTALKGEPPAEQRLNALLARAFGADWSAAKLTGLLAGVGYAGKSLDDWLRDGFFAQHCELFQQRPFIWHIWDGRRDGFHALVNYHRLAAPNGEGRRTLEKLIYSYLGDWIDRQRSDQKAGVEGADARLAHAEHLKAELIKILEGEPPYDIFVRWKSLHEQPLGWDPDINDGVRMHIRPFMTARTLNARGANACILRTTPKVKWDKDRGKEPPREKEDYPWFWGWDEATADFAGGSAFDGNRWNDLHYSRAVKQAARDRHRAKTGGKS